MVVDGRVLGGARNLHLKKFQTHSLLIKNINNVPTIKLLQLSEERK